MRERTGGARQECESGLTNIFGCDEFGQLRLLKSGGLSDGQPDCLIQCESIGGLASPRSIWW
jgi:hypothetical protein